jgi:hypothetical protein
MHKASSLSELGFNAGTASSGFFRPVADDSPPTPSAAHRRLTKVSVIGAGNVGMAIAQTILTQNLADEIALVDALPDKLRGEALDLQHGAAFLPRVRIVSRTDATVTKNSDLVVITAGARQIPGICYCRYAAQRPCRGAPWPPKIRPLRFPPPHRCSMARAPGSITRFVIFAPLLHRSSPTRSVESSRRPAKILGDPHGYGEVLGVPRGQRGLWGAADV